MNNPRLRVPSLKVGFVFVLLVAFMFALEYVWSGSLLYAALLVLTQIVTGMLMLLFLFYVYEPWVDKRNDRRKREE
jgi:hypothetical protein